VIGGDDEAARRRDILDSYVTYLPEQTRKRAASVTNALHRPLRQDNLFLLRSVSSAAAAHDPRACLAQNETLKEGKLSSQ
jgi:hypothetical protein